jgi:hypothetical protein
MTAFMGAKTNPADAEGLAKVIERLKRDHQFPHAYISSQIGISRQAIHKWSKVPLHFVADIERLSGINRRKILPSIFAALEK